MPFAETDLPAELWTKVALDSNPLDVVFLSQTCTALRLYLANEPVWKAILRNVMCKYGEILVSYSIDEMSLEALQKAAAGPHRWINLVKRSAIPAQELTPAFPVQPVTTREWHEAPDPDQLGRNYHLAPGGRFLVVQGFEVDPDLPLNSRGSVKVILTLWDFGVPGSETEPIRLTTHVLARRRSTLHFQIALSLEVVGFSLRVAVSFTRNNGEKSYAFVLEVSLNREDTSFRVLASIQCKDSAWIPGTRILGDRVLIAGIVPGGPRFFLLWDYRTSRICQWGIQGERDVQIGCVLTYEYILSITPEGVCAWDISLLDMARVNADALARHPLLAPHWELQSCWPFRMCLPRFFTTLPFLRDIERNNALFELLCYEPPESPRIVRYQLTVTRESDGIRGVLKVVGAGSLPRGESHYSQGPFCSNGIWSASPKDENYNIVHDATARMYAYHPREPPLHDSSLDAAREWATATPVMRTYLGFDREVLVSCAFSGRVIYQKWEKAEGGDAGGGTKRIQRVYCADYLS